MSIFDFLSKRKRKEKRERKELAQTCKNFKTLELLQKKGLILWDEQKRRLFLEQPIAMVMMASEKKWRAFLQNCFAWIYYQECQSAVDAYMLDEELKAVRKAKKVCNTLNMRDIQRIKSARRSEIAFSDIEGKAPKVQPFEFFVIRENSEAVPVSKNHGGAGDDTEGIVPGGELLCVGQYNPTAQNFDIALWSDVKNFLQQKRY